MSKQESLPAILQQITLQGIRRMDVALEGDWSQTVVTVWTRENGFLGFTRVTRRHALFKPSLELHFGDSWVGLHCFEHIENRNVFDETRAIQIIQYIENNITLSRS